MSKLKSRKLWASVIAGSLVICNEGLDLNLDSATIMSFSGIIISYVLGQSYVDKG